MSDTLRYTVGAEMEIAFTRPGSANEAWGRDCGWVELNPGELGTTPTDMATAQAKMRRAYADLVPETPQDEVRQREWLEYIDSGNVTPGDIINYRVYAATSKPTLRYADYSADSTYSQVTTASHPVEFRGPGLYQTGWYDNPGISEVRIAPTPSESFQAKRVRVLQTIGAIATQEGHCALLASQHNNIGIYWGEQPVPATLDRDITIASGLRTIYKDGGFINPDRYDAPLRELAMGSLRNNFVRFHAGRVEARCRPQTDGPDFHPSLLSTLAGIDYGLKYATIDEKDTILTSTLLKVTPEGSYDKIADLDLIRTLESIVIDDKDGLTLVSSLRSRDATKTFQSLLGREVKFSSTLYQSFFTRGVALSQDGLHLQTDAALLNEFAKNAGCRPENVAIDEADIPAINAKLAQFRTIPTEAVYHRVISRGKPRQPLRNLRRAQALPLVAPAHYANLLERTKDFPE